MKCPFKKQNIGIGPYGIKEEFRDCDQGDCMAFNESNRSCNLCSDKRVFNMQVKK